MNMHGWWLGEFQHCWDENCEHLSNVKKWMLISMQIRWWSSRQGSQLARASIGLRHILSSNNHLYFNFLTRNNENQKGKTPVAGTWYCWLLCWILYAPIHQSLAKESPPAIANWFLREGNHPPRNNSWSSKLLHPITQWWSQYDSRPIGLVWCCLCPPLYFLMPLCFPSPQILLLQIVVFSFLSINQRGKEENGRMLAEFVFSLGNRQQPQ